MSATCCNGFTLFYMNYVVFKFAPAETKPYFAPEYRTKQFIIHPTASLETEFKIKKTKYIPALTESARRV